MNEHREKNKTIVQVLTSDRASWYIVAGTFGITLAAVSAVFYDKKDRVFVAVGIWFAWMLCVWLFDRHGFWIAIRHFLGAIWRPFGIALGAIWRPFGVALGAIKAFLEVLFFALGHLLGALVGIAIFAFFVLGLIGILWFGISQLL